MKLIFLFFRCERLIKEEGINKFFLSKIYDVLIWLKSGRKHVIFLLFKNIFRIYQYVFAPVARSINFFDILSCFKYCFKSCFIKYFSLFCFQWKTCKRCLVAVSLSSHVRSLWGVYLYRIFLTVLLDTKTMWFVFWFLKALSKKRQQLQWVTAACW